MEKYFYKKEYKINPQGGIELINPDMVFKYISEKCGDMCKNIDDADSIRNIKLEILNDFKKIYRYDLKNAIYPEPFGTFDSQEEKKEFIRKKILVEDFYLYLGNIFSNYHADIIKKRKQIPILDIPKFVIDFNEIYKRALDEYFLVLTGRQYPKYIIDYNTNQEWTNEYINIKNGQNEKIEGIKIDEKITKQKIYDSVYATSYMLPTLIEKFLIINIQIKLFNRCMEILKELYVHKVIELDEEEEILYNIFIKKGNKLLSGNMQETMNKMYKIFVKYNAVKETNDNELILTGKTEEIVIEDIKAEEINTEEIKTKKTKITLGSLLCSEYVKEVLKPEYLYIMNMLFNQENLNYRNTIMHGNDSIYNCFAIGFSSVMVQLLWDIGSHDIFNDNKI